jgi:hypothetical protein
MTNTEATPVKSAMTPSWGPSETSETTCHISVLMNSQARAKLRGRIVTLALPQTIARG